MCENICVWEMWYYYYLSLKRHMQVIREEPQRFTFSIFTEFSNNLS